MCCTITFTNFTCNGAKMIVIHLSIVSLLKCSGVERQNIHYLNVPPPSLCVKLHNISTDCVRVPQPDFDQSVTYQPQVTPLGSHFPRAHGPSLDGQRRGKGFSPCQFPYPKQAEGVLFAFGGAAYVRLSIHMQLSISPCYCLALTEVYPWISHNVQGFHGSHISTERVPWNSKFLLKAI